MAEATIPSDVFAGRFEDWQLIAIGGEGRLYRVRDRWSGRIQALKLAARGDADSACRALIAEFDLLTRLRHPCLVESRDLLRHGDTVGHLLDYVPVVDPWSLHGQGGEDAILAAFIQSLRGLEYLHRHGWTHSDVAPGNLLVWKDGEQWRVRVSDLGLVLPEGDGRAGIVRGTLGYLAPEVARGERGDARSDWFSLAATVIAWIDGGPPGERLPATDALKARASLTAPLQPRRRVSPRLEAWLRGLSAPDPLERCLPDWEELRDLEAAWGPPVLQSGTHGLQTHVEDWVAWAGGFPPGRGGVLFLRGRKGSGRATASEVLARSLVVHGWARFSAEPLATVRDWIAEAGDDPDPVRVARVITDRFAGSDVVVSWPEDLPESSRRLMQAFVAARGDDEESSRTLVIRPATEGEESAADRWLKGTMSVREVVWTGPGESGLRQILADLFPPEEGGPGPVGDELVDGGTTPLALVMRKLARVGGRGDESLSEGVEEVRREAEAIFGGLSDDARTGLALLAWSDRGWRDSSLARVADWGEFSEGVLRELEALPLVRGDFDGGVRRLRITDWLSREALVSISLTPDRKTEALTLSDRLGSMKDVHPGDLGLASAFAKLGVVPLEYVRGALDVALAEGAYSEVLAYRKVLEVAGDPDARSRADLGGRFLRAAQRLGRFAEEVEILRELLGQAGDAAERITLKRALVASLFAVGRWQEAVGECQAIDADLEATEEDRLWALLAQAEAQWQARGFSESQDLYALAEKRLRPDMKDLWLKYAVGRARQAGQTGRMDEGRVWLDRARTNAGEAICNDDPMYLNTLAGLLLTTESTRLAVEASRKASEVAEAKGDWQTFIMANSRGSVIEMAQGRMTVAAKRSREAVTTGLALGSERMAALAGCYLGHALSENGLLEAAISRADWAIRQGGSGRDAALTQNGLVLKAYACAYYGVGGQFEDAMVLLERMERPQKRGQVAALRGLYHLVRLDFRSAEREFETTIREYGRLSMADSKLIYGVYLAESRMGLGNRADAARSIATLLESTTEYDLGQYVPVCRILNALLNEPSIPNRIAIVDSELAELISNGAVKPVCFWATRILGELEMADRIELGGVRKRILGAFQKVSASCDDAQIRKEFLSAPRYRQVLLALSS